MHHQHFKTFEHTAMSTLQIFSFIVFYLWPKGKEESGEFPDVSQHEGHV